MRNVFISALGWAAIMGLALPAAAQNLVTNPSFESPVLSAAQIQQDSIPAWTGAVADGNNYGAFNNPAHIAAKDGANVAFVNLVAGATEGLVQRVATVAVGETYDASAWFGRRNGSPQSAVVLELWIGGLVVGGNVVGGTRVASVAPTTIEGGWVRGAVSYAALPGDAGQELRVRLAATSAPGAQANFDHVSVTRRFAAPVPALSQSTMLLLGVMLAAGTALIIHRRRAG